MGKRRVVRKDSPDPEANKVHAVLCEVEVEAGEKANRARKDTVHSDGSCDITNVQPLLVPLAVFSSSLSPSDPHTTNKLNL